MPPLVSNTAAVLAATILVAIALLHVYWALGGFWPGRDDESLARTVGGSVDRMPPPYMSWVVAVCMTAFAVLPLAAQGWLAAGLPEDSGEALRMTAGYLLWFVGCVFAVRGIAGFFWSTLIPSSRGTPFESLNRKIYSPLSLGIAALLLTAAT